jgi:hypothetical protein
LTVNAKGRVLLQMLRGSGLSVLNRRMAGHEFGSFTSISSQGMSVIDLYVAMSHLVERVRMLEVLGLLQGLSDHRPVLPTFCFEIDGVELGRRRDITNGDADGQAIRPQRVCREGCKSFQALLRGVEAERLARVGETGPGVATPVLEDVMCGVKHPSWLASPVLKCFKMVGKRLKQRRFIYDL